MKAALTHDAMPSIAAPPKNQKAAPVTRSGFYVLGFYYPPKEMKSPSSVGSVGVNGWKA